MIEDPRRTSFRIFNENGGKFRVSVINLCNLDCFFCHNEAMPNPRRGARREERLSTEDLLAIINAYTRLGGRQVNITGGEPLAHPEIVAVLEGIQKRTSIIVLNTNAVLAERLLRRPKIAGLDQIFASLHTTEEAEFREKLGGRSIERVMENIVALRRHGYDVQINFSLGPYNREGFEGVLDFAIRNGIKLKAIALVRPNEDPGFYGGDWVDPAWLTGILESRAAKPLDTQATFGGETTTYRIDGAMVKVKNIARARLETDFCSGCSHRSACGEGIYGVRVGPDGFWKPCLLRREKFVPVSRDRSWEDQILDVISSMIGRWENARFLTGAPG